MRKKNTVFTLLCSAMVLSSVPSAVLAEGDSTVTIGGTVCTADEFFTRYGSLTAGEGSYMAILNGYEIYLSAEESFRADVDAIWASRGVYASLQDAASAAVQYFNETNTDRTAAQNLAGYLSILQSMGGILPSVNMPAEPDVTPSEPSKPEVDQKPTVPDEEVVEPSKPDTGNNNSGSSSTKPSEKPGTSTEENKKPAESDKEDNKTPSDKEEDRKPGTTPDKNTTKPSISLSSPHAYEGSVKTLSKTTNRKITLDGIGTINLLPNFSNTKAWKNSTSAYNTPFLWGQCTWFAWGRFYEIYGFDPGFTGNGYACVGQLLNAHPDKFELSRTPAAGAVFSSDTAHNHVGIVLEYDEKTKMLTMQEGNLDIVSNPIWSEAIEDWRTVTVSESDMKAMYGDVTYAVPKAGKLSAAQRAEAKRKATMSLRNLAIEKFKTVYRDEPVKAVKNTAKKTGSDKK